VRDNRTNHCSLQEFKKMAKTARGTFDYKGDGDVFCVRWNDSSVVTVMSNFQNHLPVQTAARYSLKEKKKVQITQPKLISEYNAGRTEVF